MATARRTGTRARPPLTVTVPVPYAEEIDAPWTPSDDETLRATMTSGRGQSWAEISKNAFPDGRHSTTTCLDRWKDIAKPKSTKGPWSTEEDSTLAALVDELGAEKWVLIASRLGTRTGKQCRERWHNHLDPKIKRAPFTEEEDALIFELYAQIGSRWAEMARRLPGRPDNAIKNHFNTSLQRSKRRQSSASTSSVASLASTLDSASSSASSSPASPVTVPCSPRYSPYRSSRKRTESNASSLSSSFSAVPIYSSPLSPRGLSRSTSPSHTVTPPKNRKPAPSFAVALGRDLDKDFFSPGRHSATGFHANGPITAPAGFGYDSARPTSPTDEGTPTQHSHQRAITDGSLPPIRPHEFPQYSSAAMQPSLSDFSYDYMFHHSQLPPLASITPPDYDGHGMPLHMHFPIDGSQYANEDSYPAYDEIAYMPNHQRAHPSNYNHDGHFQHAVLTHSQPHEQQPQPQQPSTLSRSQSLVHHLHHFELTS